MNKSDLDFNKTSVKMNSNKIVDIAVNNTSPPPQKSHKLTKSEEDLSIKITDSYMVKDDKSTLLIP